jgi:hypothetical protein
VSDYAALIRPNSKVKSRKSPAHRVNACRAGTPTLMESKSPKSYLTRFRRIGYWTEVHHDILCKPLFLSTQRGFDQLGLFEMAGKARAP